jgi:uncharacterized membrane protein
MAPWFLASTGIFFLIAPLVIHFYFHEQYYGDVVPTTLGVALFATLYFLFFVITTGQTERYKKVKVDRATCEFARTSKTLFVECGGGFKAETRNHYLYENYKDSTKVGVYRMIPTSDTGLTFLPETTAIKAK